jgi:anti-anti-sigma factor
MEDHYFKTSVDPGASTEEWTRVQLSGQLTWPHTKRFQNDMANLHQTGVKSVELDLKDLSYVDSSGLASFLPVRNLFIGSGGGLRLINVRRIIRQVFISAHLDTVIDIEAPPA